MNLRIKASREPFREPLPQHSSPPSHYPVPATATTVRQWFKRQCTIIGTINRLSPLPSLPSSTHRFFSTHSQQSLLLQKAHTGGDREGSPACSAGITAACDRVQLPLIRLLLLDGLNGLEVPSPHPPPTVPQQTAADRQWLSFIPASKLSLAADLWPCEKSGCLHTSC